MNTRMAALAHGRKSSVRWRIFWFLLVLITINYVDRASLSVAMPLISKEFSLSPVVQGLILSSFFWSYTIMQIPSGMLVDRFKPRIVITVATLVWGCFQAGAGFCTNAVSLLLMRLGLGFAEASIAPAGGKLNALWLTRNERTRGASLMDGGAPLGAAVGSLLISALIGLLGSWRLAFLVAGVATTLAGVVAWYFIRNHPREHPAVNEEEASFIERSHEEELEREPANASGRAIDFLKYRSFLFMFFGFMCCNTLFNGLLTWMPSYLIKVHGLDIRQMGGSSFIIYFSGFAGELVGAWIADKWLAAGGRPNTVLRTIFGTAGVIATVSVFSVAYLSSATLVVVLLSCTVFFLRWGNLYWCIPPLLATRNKVGALGGFLNLGAAVGGIGAPILVGGIVQATGSYFLAMMFFAATGVGLLLCSLGIDYEKKLPV
ncbi:MFS transporter [Paraburkholderia sp. RL17-337-BIB-A]|uniref:MFS transporter n=1 Tax=Paraburkholderia sp. RL17-337-BIB-A TaxID=3031636 RepID=UPI0038B927A4